MLQSDIPSAAGVLAAAFQDTPVFSYLMPEKHSRLKKLTTYFNSRLKSRQSLEEIEVATDTKGSIDAIAIWKTTKPANKQTLLAKARFLSRMGIRTWLRDKELNHALTNLKVHYDHSHLDVLAVAPWAQRKGLGTKLVQSGIKIATIKGLAVILETREDNTEYYRRLGFEVDASVPFTKEIVLYRMVKSP